MSQFDYNMQRVLSDLICSAFDNFNGRGDETKCLMVAFRVEDESTLKAILLWSPGNYVSVFDITMDRRFNVLQIDILSHHDSCWRQDGVESWVGKYIDKINGLDSWVGINELMVSDKECYTKGGGFRVKIGIDIFNKVKRERYE